MRQIWRIMRHNWRITAQMRGRDDPTADLKRDQRWPALNGKTSDLSEASISIHFYL
jgi:hypothetical protein